MGKKVKIPKAKKSPLQNPNADKRVYPPQAPFNGGKPASGGNVK